MSYTAFTFCQFRYSQAIASMLCLTLVSTMGIDAAKASVPPLLAQSQPAETINPVAKKLLGQWRAKEPSFGSTRLILVFTPDEKLFLFVPSDSGTSFAYESRYRINPNTQPMQMDVSEDSSDRMSVTIFEFTADGKLRLENTNPGEPRPTAFTAKALLLEKISETTTLPPNTEVLKPDIRKNRTQENRSRESEGKLYIRSMNRGQQAYYLEMSKFATTIQQLGIDIKPETENYRYRILSQGDRTQRVIITATAKQPEFRSYTSIVFVAKKNDEYSTFTNICETDKPSSTPPTISRNASWQIQCSAGSHLLTP